MRYVCIRIGVEEVRRNDVEYVHLIKAVCTHNFVALDIWPR